MAASALAVITAMLGLYYLSRAEVGCALDGDATAEQACYSLDLLGFIPIARVQYSSSALTEDGTTLMTLTLDPIGIARRFTEGDRFEVASRFDSASHVPEEFSISQYDKKGLRSTKTTRYDLGTGVLRWSGYSPPERNKSHESAEIPVEETVHSPLSAIYHLLDSLRSNGREDIEMEIQVKKYRYSMRADVGGAFSGKGRAGGVVKIPVTIASNRKHREEWRRQKAVKVRVYFPRPSGSSSRTGLLPLKAALPLHLASFNLVEPAEEAR